MTLSPRGQAYWNHIIPGVALGYRLGARASFWMLPRREKPTDGRAKYRYQSFAFTDDFDPADGDELLDDGDRNGQRVWMRIVDAIETLISADRGDLALH